MRTYRKGLVTGTCLLGLLVAMPTASAGQPAAGLSARARAQIEAWSEAKASRTSAEAKVDARLLTAAQLRLGHRLPAGVPAPRTGVEAGADGRTQVAVRGDVTPELRQRLRQLGGEVLTSRAAAGTASVALPVQAVPALAALPEVRSLQSLEHAYTTGRMGGVPTEPTKQERAQKIRAGVQRALAAQAATSAAAAPVVSEGDHAHGADRARTKRRLSGLGVTVGVLSDGVSDLDLSVAAGELPADVDVLHAGAGNEGTAMLEVVHDVAPGARLAFATGLETPEDFAAHIRALHRAGADVIVDDLVYHVESPFQDGPVARAVAEVSAAGALYVSSTGNQGNVDDGTAATYEGTFRPSGGRIGKYAGAAHDFDPRSAVQLVNPTAGLGAGRPAMLHWAEPLGAARTDYDLYALDVAGNVVAAANSVQDGDDDPFEQLILPDLGGEPARLAVVKYSGSNRYFHLSVTGDRFLSSGGLVARTSPGASRGHANVPAAVEVGAAPASEAFPSGPGEAANPAGPYPGRFTAAQESERFTSDGPRRMFFTPGGAALTPGEFGSDGGRVRAAPDVTAADGVRTSVLGFDPFFGTSAAAPHVAGIAALAMSGQPGLTPAALRTAMRSTAVDIERRGLDRSTGDGMVMAEPLLAAVGARAQPYATAGAVSVTSSTDGDAFLEPGERGVVSVPVTNLGGAAAAAVSVRLRSNATSVQVTSASRSYGTLAAGASRRRSFVVTVPRSWPVGKPVTLRSRVSFRGDFSPLGASTRLVLGQPAPTARTFRYTGPPRSLPDGTGESVSVRLPVTGAGRVSRVTFSLDGARCETTAGSRTVGLAHTFPGDLVGTLTAPDGTRVLVLDHVGSDGHNFCRTVLEDAAERPIAAAPPSAAPFTGRWRPSQPLAAFAGRSGNGAWTFTVEDTEPLDEGTLHRFSLRLEGYARPPA